MNRREIRRGLGNFAAITKSRLSGKTFVPNPRHAIFIETSGRCNLACRFCAYDKLPPGNFMDNETFSDVVDQVCDMGFRQVWLTPMLGEVFADRQISDKWALLEKESRIDGFAFYSNFIMAREEQIKSFPTLSKLTGLYISLYGFDANSFQETTRKPASQFSKLLKNLTYLLEVAESWAPLNGINFNVRTVKTNVPIIERDTKLGELLRKFVAKGANVSEDNEYDSWAGTISQDEVASLGIELTDGNHLYMHGACTKGADQG
jgi:MoaA/NifB/PqqE/SkfB family radical SAM enzyme